MEQFEVLTNHHVGKEKIADVIAALSYQYDALLHLDFDSGAIDVYLLPEWADKSLLKGFSESGYQFCYFIDHFVCEEDKQRALIEMTNDAIRNTVSQGKQFVFTFRMPVGGEKIWHELRFAHYDEHHSHNCAIVGLRNVDEKMRMEQERMERIKAIDAEERERIQAEMKRNFDIIEILASEYSSVYHIDLLTDALTPYSMNAETESEFGQIFNSGITYSEAFKLYVDKLIYEDDKQMMLSAGSIENIKKELRNKKTFLTQYRSADNKYSEMKFVKVGGDTDEPMAVALGFAEKDEEVRKAKQHDLEQKRYYAVVKALSSEYSSIYYADIANNVLMPYSNSPRIVNRFGEAAFSGMTHTEAVAAYVNNACSEKDKAALTQALSPDYMQEQLRDKTYYTLIYQNEKDLYCEMKCVRVNEGNTVTNVVVGFAVKDEEIRESMRIEEEKQRNFDIIEILASEYSSVYYIDLATDGLTPYTMNAETESEFGQIFNSGITYSEAFKLYVDRLIFTDDKQMMLLAGSIKNIKEELRSKKTFITQYRSADNKYSEMKFVKVGGDNDEPKAVALGFAEKDEQIRYEQEIEQERQRNFDIIEILASEYSSVYYINLTTDGLNPYAMNEETETSFGSVFRSGITYSEAFRLYVDKLVMAEDKAMMLRAGSVGNIMKELRTKKTFLTTYRNSEGHYSEMKFVKVGNEEGVPTAVALGFADKDAELRARQEEETKLQRNIEIIEILASEYTSVYYIDLTTDELDPYTMNEQTETEFGKIFRSGIRYSEAFKMYVNTLVYPDDKEKMLKAGSIYNILMELSTKKTFNTTYRNSEGHYSEMKFVKVGDEENPHSVALGFADKDEEIRAEIERQQAAERDMAVISGLSDDFGCVVYASYDEGFAEHHYRFDPLFEKHIPGWSSIKDFSERLQKLSDTIMHPDDRRSFWAATRPDEVRDAVNRDNVYFVNFRTLINGEVTYYQAKFVKDESSENHVIAGFHNVDAETKRELEALARAESASRAKTDFLFNMSHDIRTPMNAIIGFTDMAINDIDDKMKTLDCLEKVKTSGKMLLSLINDILDMSRIESGKVQLHEEKVNIESFYDSLESVMSNAQAQKKISLTFDINGIRDKYVYMDQPRLERILVNLLSNAIKYTPSGGMVNARLTQLDNKGEDTAVYRFEVEDNGIGMSEEFQEHMWEEFAREETSTISGIQGTGLGLSLALKLTVLMGGEISCKSKQGEGSTFFVTIPLHLWQPGIDDDDAESHIDISHIDLTGKKVLLVEDNELNREIAVAILESYGLEVDESCDGKSAVEAVIARGPKYYDFILMDIQMPIMNGYEATRQIRQQIPDLKAPIIALSANAFEEDKQKSREAGMDDHIAKPIDILELITTLTKFME